MQHTPRHGLLGAARIGAALGSALLSTPLHAQAEADSSLGEHATATSAADDAFGEQVGTERIGLYNLYQTRGFDLLGSSGAFRLDGAFYFPSELPTESLLAGASIRVGAGAAAVDLPSPTGVILYRLREPGPESALGLTVGLRAFHSPVVAVEAHWRAAPSLGFVGHVVTEPHNRSATGEPGESHSAATVVRWKPFDGANLTAFGSWGDRESDGYVAVMSAGSEAPPALDPGTRYGPEWLRTESSGSNSGLVANYVAGDWEVGIAAFRSAQSTGLTEGAVLDLADDSTIRSTIVRTPPGSARSDAAEARLARRFEALGAVHRLGVALRGRRSLTKRGESAIEPGGSFSVASGAEEVPDLGKMTQARRAHDTVDQRLLSVTYGLAVRDVLELRLGAHANRHSKSAIGFDQMESRTVEKDWLLNASLVLSATDKLNLFASYVTGLEESGIAPPAARNRGEVLPPVKAKQIELGGTYRLGEDLTLIFAAFDISKPTFGLRTDKLFGPSGTVHHRGVEGSIVGQIAPGTRILIGANLVDPVLSAGGTELTAPGVSLFNAIVGFEQKLTGGLSIDGNLYFEGARRRDATSDVEIEGVPFLTLGARYALTSGKLPVELRVQGYNLLDHRGYYATPGGPLAVVFPMSWRAEATVRF